MKIERTTGVRISEQAVQYARKIEGIPASSIRKSMTKTQIMRCKPIVIVKRNKVRPIKVLKLLTRQKRKQVEAVIVDIACRRHGFTDEDIAFNVNKRCSTTLRGSDVAFIRRSLKITGMSDRTRRHELGLEVCPFIDKGKKNR